MARRNAGDGGGGVESLGGRGKLSIRGGGDGDGGKRRGRGREGND